MDTQSVSESEQVSFRRFFDLSIDMLCVASFDGHFLFINQAFSRVLGYPTKTLMEGSFLDYVHPEDVDATLEEMKRLERGEVSLSFENRYRHQDGHYLTFSWNAQVDENAHAIYATARDITIQRNKEAKLTQLEKALQRETILVETDRKGVIIDVNDKFCEISGYSREELIGNTHKMVNSGHHPHRFFVEMWRTISSKKIWTGVIKNRKKNGDHYYVQTVITPITNHEGDITSYIAVRQDITNTIQYENEMERVLDILNETSAIAKVGGWEMDVASGELTWTDETFRILEVEKKLDQKPVLPEGIQLFIPEHQPIIEAAINDAIEKGRPYSLELKAKTAKGNELWVYTNGKPNYVEGELVSLSGTIQDIDAKKKAEYAYNMERQKSIHNAKLASLGELAASMAHEINNPLGIITGYSELLLMSGKMEDAQSDKVRSIIKSCDRISHIVSNLRKFSRKDADKTREVQHLSVIILEAIAMARPRLKRELVEIEFDSCESDQIECQPIEIEQVFLNLINNSIDALSNCSLKEIQITLKDLGKKLECQVRDSGKGVPEELRDNIFEPFFSSKQAGHSIGLGLSIVKDLLSEHDASIRFDSASESTAFVLEFPKYSG